MFEKRTLTALKDLLSGPVLDLTPGKRLVIFSDLHMGNGGRNDDFSSNAELFQSVLKKFYLKKDYTLILNGDVEELLRFKEDAIRKHWSSVYKIFDAFATQSRLIKIAGNHDPKIQQTMNTYPLFDSLRIRTAEGSLLVFHGHQAGVVNCGRYNNLVGGVLRLLANPLGIKNFSPAYHKKSRYVIEKRVYQFAKQEKVLAVMGHTHRPLFESKTKTMGLENHLDVLYHRYAQAGEDDRRSLDEIIKVTKKDLADRLVNKGYDLPMMLYNKQSLLPCLFNSGCGIGKRGITALEISRKKIRLVHWLDLTKPVKGKITEDYETRKIWKGRWCRTVLRKSNLSYIFTLMKFNSSPEESFELPL